MIVFCHLQYINHHKVIYFTRELLVRPMGSISQIESAGHIRWKNRVCSFYQLNQTLDQGRVSTKTAYSLLHPPYQGYSQDAERDANTNIHPKNMFPGIFPLKIIFLLYLDWNKITLGVSQFPLLKKVHVFINWVVLSDYIYILVEKKLLNDWYKYLTMISML